MPEDEEHLKRKGWEPKNVSYNQFGHSTRAAWRHPALGRGWKSIQTALTEQDTIDKYIKWMKDQKNT